MSGNFLMINGKIMHVINSTVEVEDGDRIRWSIVTEEMMPFMAMRYASAAAEVQPAAPADATAARSIEDCPGGESCSGHSGQRGFSMPDSIIDHLREVEADLRQELFRNSGPVVPRPLLDGPPLLPARSTYVPCLGQECTGCSDPECWTVAADGGDQ